VPETLGALLAFVLLAMPGMTFELLRQRRRASWGQTGLEETVRIAFASIVLDTAGVLIFALVFAIRPSPFFDLTSAAKIGLGEYSKTHVWALLLSVSLIVAIAELLALLVHRSMNAEDPKKSIAVRMQRVFENFVRHQDGKQIERSDVWQQLFRKTRPPNSDTAITIVTSDASMWSGRLAGYTTGAAESRDIALQSPIQVHRANGTDTRLGDGWELVIIPGVEIREIYVGYVKKSPEPSK
jgi:Family of unknown function (DUF6338)